MISSYLINRLRSITALIMFGYVFIHLGNHILGLVGIEAMEVMRNMVTRVIRNPIGTAILAISLLVHFLIAMRALYHQSFLHLARWQQLQLISGIAMILLLIPHVVPIRGYYHGFEVDTTYALILQKIWLDAGELVRQFALLIVAWIHICLGLHYWLKTKSWYRKNLYWSYALAVIWPTLALIGFIQSGYEAFEFDVPELDDPTILKTIHTVQTSLLWFVIGASILMLVLKQIRRRIVLANGCCNISINQNQIKSALGVSILNNLRFADVAHASVCGGRARCTTCRVKVEDGEQNLSEIGELEALALKRINAPPNVRLACQATLNGNVSLTPLLPADATMRLAQPEGGISGHERQVVAMFVDLRDSTKLAEEKLPYDVLFILNEFFTEMSKALHLSNGHYAQFAGDGLMALYGLETDLKTGCINALRGAKDMLERVDALNNKIHSDLESPLNVGIGLHCGEAIVGSMGPPKSPNYSAIGDNINVAARLEAQTKSLNCKVVVSKKLLDQLNIDNDHLTPTQVSIRGRESGITVYPITDPDQISALIKE